MVDLEVGNGLVIGRDRSQSRRGGCGCMDICSHTLSTYFYDSIRFDSTFPRDIARPSSAFQFYSKSPLFTNTPFSPTYTTRYDLTRRMPFPSITFGAPAAFLSNNSNSKRGSSASHHVVTSHLNFQHISAELVWIWDRLLFSPPLRSGWMGGSLFKEYTSVRGKRFRGELVTGVFCSVLFFVATTWDRCEWRLRL